MYCVAVTVAGNHNEYIRFRKYIRIRNITTTILTYKINTVLGIRPRLQVKIAWHHARKMALFAKFRVGVVTDATY